MHETEVKPAFTVVCARDESRENWLAHRRSGVGSSDSAILLLGKLYGRSRIDLFMEKVGTSDDERTQTMSMRLGLDLEETAMREYTRLTGVKAVAEQTLCRSVEFPFMLCTCDALTMPDDGILEVKTQGNLEAWRDGVPEFVTIQVHHQGIVRGTRNLAVVVLAGGFGGMQIKTAEIPYDDSLANQIVDASRDFWRYVEDRETPPATEHDGPALGRMYGDVEEGEVVQLDGEFVTVDALLETAKAEKKAAQKEADRLGAKIKAAIGNAEAGALPNGVVYTWKKSKKGTRALLRKEAR